MPTAGAPQYQTNSPVPPIDAGGTSVGAPTAPTTQVATPTDTGSSSGGVDWSSILSSVGGVAPYLAAGGLGLYTANNAANQNNARVNTLTGLGQPLLNESNSLMSQANAGKLTPEQQAVVDLAGKQGQDLINAASPLSSIANTGFQQYQAGQLQPGQQQQLDAWVAAQKAQLNQTLGSAGIADSTILSTQGASIDAQAEMMKQQMLQQNLGVANTEFSQWLTTTQAGQQVQLAGKQFAVTSLDNMLTQALNFAQVGIGPIQNAVALGVQSDNQLSSSIQQLMQGLMTAYAIQTYNHGGGKATGGGVSSAVGGLLGKLTGGGGASGDPAAAARASGAIDSGTIASQYAAGQQGAPPGVQDPTSSFYNPSTDPNSDINNISTPDTAGYQLNADQTVNTDTFNSYFFDPSADSLPDINFGD